jgi:hypothetical protein
MTPDAPFQRFSTLPDRPSASEGQQSSVGDKINEASPSKEQVHPRDKDILETSISLSQDLEWSVDLQSRNNVGRRLSGSCTHGRR